MRKVNKEYMDWWSTLEVFEKVLWAIAIPATIILFFQLVLVLIGGDVDGDMDAEMDTDMEVEGDHGVSFQFFSLKNVVAFFTVFSWAALACLDLGMSKPLSLGLAFIAGLLMMLVMASIFYYASKLTSSGSLNMKNAIGAMGEVYLTIPANKSGFGKVQVKIQGALREMDAITEDQEEIATGRIVVVSEVTSNNVLIVKLK